MDTAMDPWQRDVADFAQASLPPPPARVLEVGCGSGWLSHHLAAAGHDVRGIDPEAPEDPLLTAVALEDLDGRDPFDAAVASLSLHHMADLGEAVAKLAEVLTSSGALVIVEFAWDRFDDATAMWCLDRLPDRLDDDNWLHRCLAPLRQRRSAGEPLRAREQLRGWAAEEGLHSSLAVRAALRDRFEERSFERTPYLYRDLDGATGAQERSAIDAGEIQAIGFRVVASVRA